MKKFTLRINNLSVAFSSTLPVLDRVSFDVARNSFTALVGESGSGKSVTALSVTKLIKPYRMSGEILFDSNGQIVNLSDLTGEEMRKVRGGKIAYVFQDPGSSLNPVLTIGDQLTETYRAHFETGPADAKERALTMLEAVRLHGIARVFKSYPHELSGGMRQRAMIAMALISGPEILIADEPTTALDPKVEGEILELLVSLKKEKNLAILFITHDLGLAKRYADAIVIMKNGKVVGENDDYAKRLFRAVNFDVA